MFMTAIPEAESPPPLREDDLAYTPTARSVTLARRRAVRLVAEWGYPELAPDVGLVVSELTSNALLHGCLRDRLFRVRLALGVRTLRVEVSDPRGERAPEVRDAGDDEQFGRGLCVVASLVERWGIVPRTVGKTVVAEFALK